MLIMPKKVSQNDYHDLLQVIGQFPGEMAVRDLVKLDLGYSKRTLQRRLDQLVATGKLIARGNGRGRRYELPTEPNRIPQTPCVTSSPWLSAQGHELQLAVMKPIPARTPVSYQLKFLVDYEPNHTCYLPLELRRSLADMGKTGDCELPAGTYLRQIMGRLMIDLSWNSSRLEGNTYSLLDTERLLDLGESAEGKNAEETQMILNHKAAIEMLADETGGIAFNRYTICNLHAILSDNLLPDPSAGGRLRSRLIGIGQSVYEPLQVPQQIESCFDMMLEKAEAISDPFEQSFFVMVHLPYLQPFDDVNKRVSRLAANIPLIRKNLCPLSFVDVEREDYIRATLAVYELNRIEYLRDVYAMAYRRSCARYSTIRQSLGDPDPFRLRYRNEISSFIQAVVRGGMDKRTASKWISAQLATRINGPDQARFREVVEAGLSGLHEGNIARYKIRPMEFKAWRDNW